MWDLLQFIWTLYTPHNFICVPVKFTCTYIVWQKHAHLFYHRYEYMKDISYTMQHLWLIISNSLFYFVPGTIFLIFLLCAYVYNTYIWGKMKKWTSWQGNRYLGNIYFYSVRTDSNFFRHFYFWKQRTYKMLKSALLDEVFICLRTRDSFFHHQDDQTLGENDLFSAHLLVFLSEEALCVIWNVIYSDIKMEILRLCQKMTLSMWNCKCCQ